MTKLTYILYDGTETTSYVQALATGKPFTKRFTPIKKEMDDDEKALRAKRLAKFGYNA